MSEKVSRTAAELMAELEADASWVAKRSRLDLEHEARVSRNRQDEKATLERVASQTGVKASSLANLRENCGPGVVAVLIEQLPLVDNIDVKRDIISVLATGEWGRPVAAKPLVAEFDQAPAGKKGDGLRWSIASALEHVADSAIQADLIRLVLDESNGAARQMLTLALGKSGTPSAIPVLIGLLSDRDVAGHAVTALIECHASEARAEIETLRFDDRLWVRQEVSRALELFEPDAT